MRECGPLRALQQRRLHALQTGVDIGVAVSATPQQALCIMKRLQYSVGVADLVKDDWDHWARFGRTATQAYQVLVDSFLSVAQLERQQRQLRQQIKQVIGDGSADGSADLLHSDSEDSMCRSSSSGDSDFGSSDEDDSEAATGNTTDVISSASHARLHSTTTSSDGGAGSQLRGTDDRGCARPGASGGGSALPGCTGAGPGAGPGAGQGRQGTVAGKAGCREDQLPDESWVWCARRRRRAMRELGQLRRQAAEQLERWRGSEALRRLERAEEELCAALGQAELGRAVARLPVGGATAGAAAAGLEAAETRVASARAEFEDAWVAMRWLLEDVGWAMQQFADHHCMLKSRNILTEDRRRPWPQAGQGRHSSGHGEASEEHSRGGIDWEALVRQAREELQRSRSSSGDSYSNSRSGGSSSGGGGGGGGGCWEEAVAKRIELLVREELLEEYGDDAEVAALYGLVLLHAVQGIAPRWLLATRRMATTASVLLHCRTALAEALAPAYASRVTAAAAEEDAAAEGGASSSGGGGGGGGAGGWCWSWGEAEWRQSMLDGRKKAASDVRRLFEWMQVTERLRRLQKTTLTPTRCARHVARVRRLYERGRELEEQLRHTANELALAEALKAMEMEQGGPAEAAAAMPGDSAAAEGAANKGRKKRKGKGKGGTKADVEAWAEAGDGEEGGAAARRVAEAGRGEEEQAVDAQGAHAAAGGASPAAATREGPSPAQRPAASHGASHPGLAAPAPASAPAPAPPPSARTTANSIDTTALTTPAGLPGATAPASGHGPVVPFAPFAPMPFAHQSRRMDEMFLLARLSLVRDVLRRRQEQLDAARESVQVPGAKGTAVRIESLQQYHAFVEANNLLPAQERATALLRDVAGRLLATLARYAHAIDTHEAQLVTELHRLATHRRQLQEGHQQQQQQQQREVQEVQEQVGTHGGLPAAAGGGGGAAGAAASSIRGLYPALEVCDTRTERWGDEGRQQLTAMHAAVDFWGAMGITAGVSEWELFGPPLGSRGLAGEVHLGGAGEEESGHAEAGGTGGSGCGRVGALAVSSLLEARLEANRAWRPKFDIELEQRIQRRWPVAALGGPALALALGRMAMLYGTMHAWLPYALAPPPLVDYVPGGAPAARWGAEATDLYRPRPGVPGCVLLVPLGEPQRQVVMARGAAVQPEGEQDWSFDRLLGSVRGSFHKHHGASVVCDSVEKLQTVVLVFAKLHAELGHTSGNIACVATLAGSKPTHPFTRGDAAACGEAVKEYGMRLSVAELSAAWGGNLTMHPGCQPPSRDGR